MNFPEFVAKWRKLDEAVSAACGWDAPISDEEMPTRLLALNCFDYFKQKKMPRLLRVAAP